MKVSLVTLAFATLFLASCSSQGSQKKESGTDSTEVVTSEMKSDMKAEMKPEVKEKIIFSKPKLTYPSSDISFAVTATKNKLCIKPSGLTGSNDSIVHDITGYTVRAAETGDLNTDSYPEIFVYLVSDGSGSYGKFIGYSVNKGKSMSEVYLPEVSENPDLNKGYMGHDDMAIVENGFLQLFPIYKEGDTNANPTGGTRQIQYKLVDGEVGRILKIDKFYDLEPISKK